MSLGANARLENITCVGLIVNPLAGAGATHNTEVARAALRRLRPREVVTGPGELGGAVVAEIAGVDLILADTSGATSERQADATALIARAAHETGVDLLVVVGGDGTMADAGRVLYELHSRVPLLGVGAGSTNAGWLISCMAAEIDSLNRQDLHVSAVPALEVRYPLEGMALAFNDVVVSNTICGTVAGEFVNLDAAAFMSGERRIVRPRRLASLHASVKKRGADSEALIAAGEEAASVVVGFTRTGGLRGQALYGGLGMSEAAGVLAGCLVGTSPLVFAGLDAGEHAALEPLRTAYVGLNEGEAILMTGFADGAVLCADGNPLLVLAPEHAVEVVPVTNACRVVRPGQAGPPILRQVAAKASKRSSLLDRAAGMLAGVAVGDALGMPVEFLTPQTIRDWYGGISGLVQADARHPHHRLPAGSVTDDTDHTVLLAEALLADGEITPKQLAVRLLAWGRSPRVQTNRFVGPSTLRTLAALEAGADLSEVPRNGTSCGAAMRVSALAIALPEREVLERQVVASCEVSHFTTAAISGAMAMAFALSEALQQGSTPLSVAEAAKEGAKRGSAYGDWSWSAPLAARIDHAMRWAAELDEDRVLSNLFELIGVDMYADQLVPDAIALTALAEGDPNHAMLLAANLGGDADTLASMTGSLCGALSGVSAINPDWLAMVSEVNGLDVRDLAVRLVELRERRPG